MRQTVRQTVRQIVCQTVRQIAPVDSAVLRHLQTTHHGPCCTSDSASGCAGRLGCPASPADHTPLTMPCARLGAVIEVIGEKLAVAEVNSRI